VVARRVGARARRARNGERAQFPRLDVRDDDLRHDVGGVDGSREEVGALGFTPLYGTSSTLMPAST